MNSGIHDATTAPMLNTTGLADAVHGAVLEPGAPGYDEHRVGFNQTVQHHPAVIVVATSACDIQAAVAFAARNALPVVVHDTGHGVSVPADGALMISTHRMQRLSIDGHRRIARVEAGVRWDSVIEAAATFGLAPLNGSAPAVGVVSYTLGGGVGPVARTFGYAADHVRSMDVVTADGELRRASPTRNPDLFWGLRGGGGNFGVVTGIEFDLMPLRRLYGGGLYFDGALTAEVLHTFRTWTQHIPESMNASVCVLRYPELPSIPAEFRGKHITHVRIAYVGSATDGQRWVQPLREIGPRLLDTVTDMPYGDVGSVHADPTEPGPYSDRTALLHTLDEKSVDTLLHYVGPDSDCPLVAVEIRRLGGALARQPEPPNAVCHRDAAYTLFAAYVAAPEQLADAHSYRQSLFEDMQPWSTGGRYVNFLLGPTTHTEVASAYEPHTHDRLTRLKARYDPTNLFRINHNIPPILDTDGT